MLLLLSLYTPLLCPSLSNPMRLYIRSDEVMYAKIFFFFTRALSLSRPPPKCLIFSSPIVLIPPYRALLLVSLAGLYLVFLPVASYSFCLLSFCVSLFDIPFFFFFFCFRNLEVQLYLFVLLLFHFPVLANKDGYAEQKKRRIKAKE